MSQWVYAAAVVAATWFWSARNPNTGSLANDRLVNSIAKDLKASGERCRAPASASGDVVAAGGGGVGVAEQVLDDVQRDALARVEPRVFHPADGFSCAPDRRAGER
jgi:hypothetical protein